ncbi:MAG: hypothetical protein K0S51_1490 [Bacillales bacterium]|jgi:O-antigen/teichoic acid export membrane protein|nr:hypothetical protein [Bacillales bacterium]
MSTNSFAKNSLITLLRQVISILLGLVFSIIIARVLGPENQGKYSLIILVPTIIITFMNLGIGMSTAFYVSKKEIEVQRAVSINLFLGTILAVLGFIGGAFFIYFWGKHFIDDVNMSMLLLALVSLPFLFFTNFLQPVFQGIQDFVTFNKVLLIQQLSNLLLFVILALIFSDKLLVAIFAFLISFLISNFYILLSLKSKKLLNFSWNHIRKKDIMSLSIYGIKAHLSNIITFLNYRLDMFLLGYFLSPLYVGYYSVAVSISEKLSVFSQAISAVLLPSISASSSNENRNKLTATIVRLLFHFLLIVIIILYATISFLINILFGEEYSNSIILIMILLPGLFALSLERILSNDLAGRGKIEYNLYVSIFNVILNVLLNLALIPKIGVTAAAISSSITYVLSFFIKLFLFIKFTKVSLLDLFILTRYDFEIVVKASNRFLKFRRGG